MSHYGRVCPKRSRRNPRREPKEGPCRENHALSRTARGGHARGIADRWTGLRLRRASAIDNHGAQQPRNRRGYIHRNRAACPSGTFVDDVTVVAPNPESAGIDASGGVNLLIRTVYTCDDGTGSFNALKNDFITFTEDGATGTGPIHLLGGTGAYTGLAGHGVRYRLHQRRRYGYRADLRLHRSGRRLTQHPL